MTCIAGVVKWCARNTVRSIWHMCTTCAQHVHLWCGLRCQKLLIPMAFSHGLPLPMALEPDVKSYWMSRSVHTVPWIANFPCRFPPRSKLKNPNWKCKAWDVPKKAQPLSGPTTTFRFLKTWKQLPSHIPRSITGIAILVLNPGWISRVTRFLHVSP